MSKSYTPGLKILECTNINKKRILPLKGKVHVDKNENVDADKVVASTKIPGNVQMLNIANALNIDPDEVPSVMLYKVDDKVLKGQVIARSKGLFGLFKSEVKSPLNGILGNVSNITGQAIISEDPHPIEVDAYIPGRVNHILENEGVIINSTGTFIQGIIGIGGEKKGEIAIIKLEDFNISSNNYDLSSLKNKIIVMQSYLSYNIYKYANLAGVKGIVCGGIDYQTLTNILGYPLGVAITGMENVITIVVTEGFGSITMSERTFNLLEKYKGHFASINGATQIRAGVLRPEIFIGKDNNENDVELFDEEKFIISIGSKIRVIREPYFGIIGTVTKLPSELIKIDTETVVRVAEILFDDGSKKIIPRPNLEVILSD